MNNDQGIMGIDTTCHKCTECGGYPIRVDIKVDISHEKRKHTVRGQVVALGVERRTYYHCPCGFSTTDWHRPVYDKDGNIKVMGWMRARKAYIKKEWVKVGPCKHKNKMV